MTTPVTRRLVGAAALSTAIAGSFVAGWALAPGTPSPTTPVLAAHPFAAATDLAPAASCDDLLDSFRTRGRALVGPWGWEMYGWGVPVMEDFAVSGGSELSAQPTAPSNPGSAPKGYRATNNEQGTNVQEVGVDEPDVVKVDGDLLVRLAEGGLETWDVGGRSPQQLGRASLPGLSPRTLAAVPAEFLLADDVAVVLGQPADPEQPAVLTTVDVSDPASPEVLERVEIEGSIETARLQDGVVRLVLGRQLPLLDFVVPDGDRGERSAELANRELVEGTELADWLPSIDGEPVVGCDQVAVPETDSVLGSTVVTAFAPGSSEILQAQPVPHSAGVATAPGTTYVSPDRLYLATAEPGPRGWLRCLGGCDPETGRTRIDSFAVDGLETTWSAGGTVEGSIRDRWAMDSVDSSLRVAVGPTRATGDFNSVLTLREADGQLRPEGRVDHLGPGEQIKSVRWFDDLAIVVTFRQTDPLYAVGLADPAAPELLGELKIPGYSEYLHPLGDQRLIGVGQDADPSTGAARGAQAALFDISDLSDVRQLDVVKYAPGTAAGAAVDPRQFTWLPTHRTAVTVVSKGWEGRTGWLSLLSLEGGRMTNRMVRVEYGDDVDLVRTVPLASGKVVVLTGDTVTFLDPVTGEQRGLLW